MRYHQVREELCAAIDITKDHITFFFKNRASAYFKRERVGRCAEPAGSASGRGDTGKRKRAVGEASRRGSQSSGSKRCAVDSVSLQEMECVEAMLCLNRRSG